MTATIAFPTGPFVDENRNLTSAGRFFLLGLFEKLGGSVGVGTDAATVSAALTAEISARTASDAALTASITAEATNRANGDIVEAQLRTAADATGSAATAAVGSSLITVAGNAAPIDSPHLTGVPTAPTAAPGTNTTQIATTAFDTAAVAVETARATTAEGLLAPKASPALTGVPTAPTAAPGTNTTQIATTAFVQADVLAATEWNAGTVNAIDATQLVINSNTLGIKAGPTIQVVQGTSLMVVNSNTSTAFPTTATTSSSLIVGADNLSAGLEVIAVAGTVTGAVGASLLIGGRINGSFASPSPLSTDDRIIGVAIRGYETAYSAARVIWTANAGSAWTGSSWENYQAFSTVPNGSTTATERMRLLSGGAFIIGTTVAVGSEKLRVSGQALANFMMITPSAGLTAHAGGTQAAALALTAGVNYITTCATNGDSVRLPASVAGLTVEVINAGAASCQVYGASTDTINNVATATGVPVAAGKTGYYRCTVAGKWFGGTLT